MRFVVCFAALIAVMIAFASIGCGSGDRDEQRGYVAADDDVDDDDNDDNDDDDNDDNNDNDNNNNDDDTVFEHPDPPIKSPLNGVRYFTEELLLVIDEDYREAGADLFLDGDAIPWAVMQWLNVENGGHAVELKVAGEVVFRSDFEKHADLMTRYSSNNVEVFPTTITLPDAAGASTPLRIRLENIDDEISSMVGLRTPDQPDFRSAESLQAWLQCATNGMTRRQMALFLMEFVAQNLFFAAPPYDSVHTNHNHAVPDIFHTYGYCWCENHSKVFLTLAGMLGWEQCETRIDWPSGHVGASLRYDGGWHHFDPTNNAMYWNDDGRILSFEEIEGAAADILPHYIDQLGYSRGGGYLQFVASLYDSVEDNVTSDYEPIIGDARGFALEPGDVIDLFPYGFGVFACVDCAWDPSTESTGVLRRVLADVEPGTATEIVETYPLLGLIAKIEATGAGTLKVNLQLTGDDGEQSHQLTFGVSGGSKIDFSEFFDERALGEINSVRFEIVESFDQMQAMNLDAIFQFAPHLTPWIDHDRRQIIVDGQGGALRVQFDVFDAISETADIDFFAPEGGEPLTVATDGRDLGVIHIDLMAPNGEWAAGHEIAVVSDHPDSIEILRSLGRLDALAFEPVWTDWIGPDRFIGDHQMDYFLDYRIGQQRDFWARSLGHLEQSLGPVNFTLLVDGEAAAQTQIEFSAE